jgi:hypothetical protein
MGRVTVGPQTNVQDMDGTSVRLEVGWFLMKWEWNEEGEIVLDVGT